MSSDKTRAERIEEGGSAMKHGLRLFSVQFDGMPVFVLAHDFAEAIELWRRGLRMEDPESWTEEEASTTHPESVTHLAEPGDVNLLALPPDPPADAKLRELRKELAAELKRVQRHPIGNRGLAWVIEKIDRLFAVPDGEPKCRRCGDDANAHRAPDGGGCPGDFAECDLCNKPMTDTDGHGLGACVPMRSAGGPRMRRSCTHRGSGECTIGCWAVDKRGLYAKFIVKRSDGRDGPGEKHEHCDYFVLDLTHDEHAKAAIIAYANDCAEKRPQLALDLRVRVGAVDLSEAKPAGELAQEEAAAVMDNNLSGRDLDVACARAMGWTIDGYAAIDGDGPSVARWKRGSDYELRIMEPLNDPPPPRRYSTDPSTLDEKLEWLRKRGFIVLSIGDDNETSARFMQWNADVEDILVVGTDIHEATARLVVAVKEAMGDG